jgi:hypothetical protein
MSQTIELCTSEQELEDVKSLILPIELQSLLPEDYYWAFVKEDGVSIGALMWPFGTEMPTEISLAPTLLDENNPNQNLYWGGE